MLDEGLEEHRAKWGCEWNKDIDSIVEEAGLEVLQRQRWHFGTTYVYVAKPRTLS